MATEGVPRLTLYSRRGCHLCEEMARALQALQRSHAFEFEVVDVDASPDLARLYGERIPVLSYGERALCHAQLDAAAVTAFLRQFR